MSAVSKFITKYMAAIVALAAVGSYFFPACGMWIAPSWINPLLAAIMFGMGLTLKASDFAPVFTRPRDIAIGSLLQFTMMPALAWGLVKLFGLEGAAAVGMVLVGACPGGTASNVVAFLARGDVAFSVAMTGLNTLLAPLMTPLVVYVVLRESIDVDFGAMFLAILAVVILPLAAGVAVKKICPQKLFERLVEVLPAVAVASITLIVACVVARNAHGMEKAGGLLFAAVALHNLAGLAGGFAAAKIFGMDAPKAKSLSIEIGMQNSGLAAALAYSAFPALAGAAVPAAIFSAWHNISGSIAAWAFRKWVK